jgi:hypothetical protein
MVACLGLGKMTRRSGAPARRRPNVCGFDVSPEARDRFTRAGRRVASRAVRKYGLELG